MPTASPLITLFLLSAAGNALHAVAKQRLPALELLLARAGELRQLSLPSDTGHPRWQSQLLHTLGLSPSFASAAVSWLGSGGDDLSSAGGGTWLHATPMHYAVTLNGLSMHQVTWNETDASIIEQIIASHVAQDGFVVRRIGRDLYLTHPDLLDVQTAAAEWASRVPLRGVLPSGVQGRKLNQLATEIQMMLYEHPKLQRRSMPINALWLWGNQSIALAPYLQVLPNAWSNEPFVRGLYRLDGKQCNERVSLDDTVALDPRSSNTVIVARTTDLQSAESDWFAPLLTALRRGRWRRAYVMFGDVQFTVTTRNLWAFWRRSQPISKQLQSRTDPT